MLPASDLMLICMPCWGNELQELDQFCSEHGFVGWYGCSAKVGVSAGALFCLIKFVLTGFSKDNVNVGEAVMDLVDRLVIRSRQPGAAGGGSGGQNGVNLQDKRDGSTEDRSGCC